MKNVREANVWEEARAPSKLLAPFLLGSEGLQTWWWVCIKRQWNREHSLMDVREREFWGYAVLGVWGNTKQNPGTAVEGYLQQMWGLTSVYLNWSRGWERQSMLPQGQRGTFLLLISSTLGNFSLLCLKSYFPVYLFWSFLPVKAVFCYCPIPLSYPGGLCPIYLVLFT